jgi:hypothetical protein
MSSNLPPKGIREAVNFLRQQRRFLRNELEKRSFFSRLLSPVPSSESELDRRLETKQNHILAESGRSNNLGLYRNASLTLACIEILRGSFNSALQYLMDVAFLDMNGATNSLPGYRSFDRQFADLLPFVSDLIRDTTAAARIGTGSLEELFKARWARFSSFGKPPYAADPTWRRLKKAIDT